MRREELDDREREMLFGRQIDALVRKFKAHSPYYGGGRARESDMLFLLDKAMSRNSPVRKAMLRRYFINAEPGTSVRNVMNFMKSLSRKGMIVRWRDRAGRNFYFLNYGRDRDGKARIRILQEDDYRKLRKIHDAYLRKTVKHMILKVYQKKFVRQQKSRVQAGRRTDIRTEIRTEGKGELPARGSFERAFTDAVLANRATSVGSISENLLTQMDGRQRSLLAKSLVSRGIRTNRDYMDYLCQLRKKALEIRIERTVTRHKTVAMGRGL